VRGEFRGVPRREVRIVFPCGDVGVLPGVSLLLEEEGLELV
jgi:hypothetical protein